MLILQEKQSSCTRALGDTDRRDRCAGRILLTAENALCNISLGAGMKIITLEDPLLRKHSVLVNNFDRGLRDFVSAMFDIMQREKGIGLAAVQVGELRRLFITNAPDDMTRVFINPEILETSLDQNKYEEGCLSVPGINTEIVRPATVKVQAWNLDGRPFRLMADNMLARVIQHELDHLNGKLFIDYLDPKKRERLLKSYGSQVRV